MSATLTAKHPEMSDQHQIFESTRLAVFKHWKISFFNSSFGVKLAAIGLSLTLAACQAPVPPPKPVATGPTPAEIALKEKRERTVVTFADGIKQYEAGTYEEAQISFLVALDSGTLTLPEQLLARKTMAFMHCIAGRELRCKEEFEKAVALDPKFELSPAEAGHPTWGPVFKTVVLEADLRRRGVVIPPPAPKPTAAQVLQADATKAYDDGNYELAAKLFLDLQKQSIAADILVTARKFAAFSFCLIGKNTLCRAEFQKLLDSNSAFQLSAAEAGHPSWGAIFKALTQKPRPATSGTPPVTAPTSSAAAAPSAKAAPTPVPVKK
jgi:hypothetical protein